MNGLHHPEKLEDVLALLKKQGVRKFTYGSLQVEFEPTATAAPEPQAPPVIEDEKCRCGHARHQHSEQGFCLIGCEPDKCAAPE